MDPRERDEVSATAIKNAMVFHFSPFTIGASNNKVHQGSMAFQQEAYAGCDRPTWESCEPECYPHDVDLGKLGISFHSCKRGSTLDARNLEA